MIRPRMDVAAFSLTLAVAVTTCLISSPVLAAEAMPVPYSKIGINLTGDVIADAAIQSPLPVLVVAGVTYKAADLAHDVGDAAIERQDRWLGAEMVLISEDGKRLKEMKANGLNLNSPEADAVKQRLRDHITEIAADHNSPAGYTGRVIIKNLPYATFKVAIDKTLEAALGATFKKIGLSRWIDRKVGVPAKINWALNYGGPLEDIQKAHGWGKLGSRARTAEKFAEKVMHDQEKKIAAYELETIGNTGWDKAAADALATIYQNVMMEHPSQPRRIVAANFRLVAVRAPELILAPAAAVLPPQPIQQSPVAMRASPDPVVRAIQTDDVVFRERYESPVPRESRTVESPPPQRIEPQEDPRDIERRQALHEELMRVGDGKTFQVCSNGCPSRSDASWDGRHGQTLTHD